MNLRKGAIGMAVSIGLAAGLGAFAAVGYADETNAAQYDYAPNPLGNSAYTNQIDETNAFTVQGIQYAGSISEQNADEVAYARSLSNAIGTDGEDVSPIVVTNSTGKQITGFSYVTKEGQSYPANMMASPLADGASLCWYWKVTYDETTYTNGEGDTFRMPVNYTVQLTFSDGSTAELHDLNLNGVRTLELCYSDDYGVYYANRTTITNHTPCRTLYYEVSRAEDIASGEYTSASLDEHINGAARMGKLAWTTSRGDAWMYVGHDALTSYPNYGASTELLGEPSGDYAQAFYQGLYWNSDYLTWRAWENGR